MCAIARVILVVTLCVSGEVSSVRAQGSSLTEYQIKAAFLYNFAKFVEWPPEIFANAQSHINFCVLGEDPFGNILREAVLDKNINGHNVEIRLARRVQDVRGCQVLFISTSEQKHLTEIFVSLRGASILTVSDSGHFAERGGAIQFVLEENRIHFLINVDAAERSRLKMSSKLLALAKVVRDESARGKS